MKQVTKALNLGLAAFLCLFFANALAHADVIYVSNYGDNTITKFAPNGTPSTFANSGLNLPVGLAFDSSGNLYAANWGDDTITKFAPNGTPSLFANSGLNNPAGLAFDSSGNLYAANVDNTIEKFSPAGVDLGAFANSGLNLPNFIAVQVPEPATLSLLAMGVVALLGGRRLRRRSS